MEKQVALADELMWQKRAIYHALSGVLAENDAINAMNAWVKKFSTSGSVFGGLNQFAREVCDAYGHTGRHHELVRAMNRALVSDLNELRPLPDEDQPVAKTAPEPVKVEQAAAEPSLKTPEFECFKTLLLALLAAVEEHRADMGPATRHFLKEVIENLPWSPTQQQQVLDLLDKGQTQQMRPYRPGQLKTLMSHLVIWLQEKLDKDIAVLAVRQAIKEAGKTLAGTEYSPKEFFSK